MFSEFYDNAPVVEIEGRMFPVELACIPTRHDGLLNANRAPNIVAEHALAIIQQFPGSSEGDIFSTNIAETSVTIDGVVFVVDSGLMKGMVYDPIRKMSSLEVHAISQSSAIQRMGRAGRTQPGRCFRLYSLDDNNRMETGSAAEIFQKPLTLVMLTLNHIGIDPRHFSWIQCPADDVMEQAEKETYLGAIDVDKRLTGLGKLIAQVQLDPTDN